MYSHLHSPSKLFRAKTAKTRKDREDFFAYFARLCVLCANHRLEPTRIAETAA